MLIELEIPQFTTLTTTQDLVLKVTQLNHFECKINCTRHKQSFLYLPVVLWRSDMKWKNVYHDNMNTLKRLKVLYFGLNYGFQIIMVKLVVNRKDCCMFHILTVPKEQSSFCENLNSTGISLDFFLMWMIDASLLLKTSLRSIETQLTCIPIGTQLTCIPLMVSKVRCEVQKSCYHTSYIIYLSGIFEEPITKDIVEIIYSMAHIHVQSPGWTMICLQ